jgi:hypothetical protein
MATYKHTDSHLMGAECGGGVELNRLFSTCLSKECLATHDVNLRWLVQGDEQASNSRNGVGAATFNRQVSTQREEPWVATFLVLAFEIPKRCEGLSEVDFDWALSETPLVVGLEVLL